MAYNSIGDRAVKRSLLWKIHHIVKAQIPNVYRPDRRMIYDHYKVPESSNEVSSSGE
jgi:hypothetical protein